MSKYTIDSSTLTDIAEAIRTKTGSVSQMTPLEMPTEIASISGGGGVHPLFDETVICDNTNMDDTLTFTEDWHDYDFLKFKIYNISSSNTYQITTTPEIIDAIFAYSSNKIMLNEYYNNQGITYRKNNNLEWVKSWQRNVHCIEVRGLTANNCVVNKEFIYCKQDINIIKETVIAPHDFNTYDDIYVASCDGNSDDTMPAQLPTHGGNGGYNFYNDYRQLSTLGTAVVETSDGWESKNLFYLQGINYTIN